MLVLVERIPSCLISPGSWPLRMTNTASGSGERRYEIYLVRSGRWILICTDHMQSFKGRTLAECQEAAERWEDERQAADLVEREIELRSSEVGRYQLRLGKGSVG